jgi:hypothetical protein
MAMVRWVKTQLMVGITTDGKIDEDPPDNGLWDIYLADVLLP